MKDETNSIYGKPNFNLIVALFAVTLLLLLVGAFFFFRTGHPDMHTQPQPKNNKGMLQQNEHAAPTIDAAFVVVPAATSRS